MAARWRPVILPRLPAALLPGAAALLTALATPPVARASGFSTARFGGEHGHVTATNPSALYYNPGALGFSEGVHVWLDGSLALRSVTWEHARAASDPPDPAGAEGANVGRAESFNVFGAPALGASVRLGDFALGAGLFVPFGGRVTWSENPAFASNAAYPLAADGVQRWHTVRGALTYVYGTLGAAYRIGPVSLGLGANLISARVATLRAYNPSGDTLPRTDQEARAELAFHGIVGSFGAGVLFEALPDHLWIGASYQAQPGLGVMSLPGTLTITYQGVARKDDVTLHQALPDSVRLGARYRTSSDTELRLFGDCTRWSLVRTQCVALADHPCAVTPSGADAGGGGTFWNGRRHWRDTFGVRAGGSHWLRPEVELFLGVGFETAATPDETLEPELPDSETLQGAFGARWEFVPRFFVAGSYTHLHYLPRDNTGKSRLSNADVPTRRPDGGGKYTQWIGIFNANFEMAF